MRTYSRTLAFAVVAAACTAVASAQDEPKASSADSVGFTQLFNGKDLTGWKRHPSAPEASKWEVKDGLLVGSGPASHIFSERGDYADFVYRVVAKINDQGNSGQYFRTRFEKGFPPGYEAQINATHKDPVKTGSLYPDGRTKLKEFRADICVLDKAPHGPDEFFTQEITAVGNHITIKVNGKVTCDFKDPNNTYTKGHFAIQQHDPGSSVSVKSVEVKELPGETR